MFCALFKPLKWLLLWFVVAIAGGLTAGDQVDFTILATADLHGKLIQLQRSVAPAVAGYREADPDGVIYVDIGDCAQGGYLIQRRRGSGVMKLLSEAGCSLWVPGNHELEYGFGAFKNMVNEFSGTVLAANLQSPELNGKFKDFVIVELNQVKVAFVGLMLQDMNSCFPVEEARFQTLPGRAVLRRSVIRARAAGADMIVLLRHAGKYGGGENLLELLKDMPEIDLVIGAHTHQGEAGCRMRRAWYVQPPPYGSSLLVIKISFDRRERQIVQMESRLEKLKRYPEKTDPDLQQPVNAYGSDPALAAVKMQQFAGSDLALYAIGRTALEKLMAKDAPLMADYYECFAYFDPVITVQVTDGELYAIMREYLRFARKRKLLLLTAGFAYRSRRGHLQGLVMEEPRKSYTLAISAYAAAGAGGQLPETRRILKNKIDFVRAESAPGILQIVTEKEK